VHPCRFCFGIDDDRLVISDQSQGRILFGFCGKVVHGAVSSLTAFGSRNEPPPPELGIRGGSFEA